MSDRIIVKSDYLYTSRIAQSAKGSKHNVHLFYHHLCSTNLASSSSLSLSKLALLVQGEDEHNHSLSRFDGALDPLTCFRAVPTTVLFTLVAKRNEQSVSPRCAPSGERLHNISVLLEPIHQSSSSPTSDL